MINDADFFAQEAARCWALSRGCDDPQLVELGREFTQKALDLGADPDSVPEEWLLGKDEASFFTGIRPFLVSHARTLRAACQEIGRDREGKACATCPVRYICKTEAARYAGQVEPAHRDGRGQGEPRP